jgi:TolB-like protein
MAYMSPEQLRGQSVDARSDIFSFGIVLYEMLAGVHPFSKGTAMDTAASILNSQPPPTSRYRKDLPEVLEHVVGKMLAKEPGDRYQLVHEVRTDLERVDARSRGIDRPSPALSILKLGTRGIKIGAAAIAAVAVLGALWFWWRAPSPPTTSPEGPPSVAVLPLMNISEDPEESDYLAEGISQAVTTKLTQVGLRVTPWDTARRYRDTGRPAEVVAKELNVDAVLIGTFQVAGDQILTNVSLVEAESGFQSWADIIVEPYEDIFRMQLRLATGVAESLKKELTGEEAETLATPESRSVDAYDFYLQGSYLMQEGDQESNAVAAEYFARALELDPDLAEAHVGLGAVHWLRHWAGTGGLESLDQAEASFDAALELNPAFLRARRGLAEVYFLRGDSEACLIQGREAARLGRQNDVEILLARAEAYWSGGLDERSLPLFRRVMELDPLNEGAYHHFVLASWVEEPQQAADVYDAYVRRFGESRFLPPWVGTAHYFLGNYDEARELYNKALTVEGNDPPWAQFFAGLFFDEMGERERAEEVWYRGIEVTKLALDDYPGHVGMRLFLAIFLGLVGERDSFLVEEERALEIADVNAFELPALAAVHAKLGESERAVELLRRSLRSGRVDGIALAVLKIAGVRLDSPPYDQFLKEYKAERKRLDELY